MNNATFKKLHSKESFFILGNCWDALSARIFEQAGYKALGTSSWALSSMQGVKDGENISFDTIFDNAKKILYQISIPLSIDIEKGYSQNTADIVTNVVKLADIGCSGINIEDSLVHGGLLPSEQFAKIIASIKTGLLANGFPDFVINARTDTYLSESCNEKIAETLRRAAIYHEAGADCLFVPGLSELQSIYEISSHIYLPLNILNLPHIDNVKDLQSAGVNRFSLGNSVFDDMLAYLEKSIALTYKSGDYAAFYNHAQLALTFK
ncbi:isocitrate lyase/phosphoenolpyruvate mutase family protein [Erwinia endophytica]|uniref:isocitrate lyase/PEP mutase family protein n=1 Tax=Erwinia endophytica TaxID=1563158 RepID=UPI001265F273|nr:isocitrate lyase/phosphoenolpyruvate mutase family protein [Erwinia endophytica]KAB8306306.1 isocitrate lyase/phosphoenolpyruvate mutase family protein [Erwinia endophytica]